MTHAWRSMVAVLSLAAAAAAAADDDLWIEVRSPHFTVVSAAGESDGRAVARELEIIRAVFQSALPDTVADPRRRLTVVAVAGADQLLDLLPQFRDGARPLGAFLQGSVEHYIVLRTDAGRRDRFRPIYHEYFHLLTSVNAGRLPAWLMEGLAEVYANTTVRGDTAEIGDARRDHLALLARTRMRPLAELLADETDPHDRSVADAGLFYAQSWALAHYLLLGDDTGRGRLAIDGYIARVRAGDDPHTAFVAAVGPLADVARGLALYVRRDGFFGMRMDAPPAVDAGRLVARPLSRAETLVARARVLIHGSHAERAAPLLAEAEALDADSPGLYEARGLAAWYRGRDAEAADAFQTAVDRGSTSYVAHYLGARLQPAGSAAVAARDAERGLRRAIALEPRFAPAYADLARLLAARPEKHDEAIDLARTATELEPSTADHWGVLAEALASAGREDEARAAIEQGLGLVRGVTARAALDAAREGLEGAEASYYRGNALRRLGRLDEAIAAYRAAIRLAPDGIGAINGLGIALRARGNLDEAIAAFQRVITVDPTSAAAHHNLGNALHGRGDLAAAVAAYREAIALDPHGAGTHRLLGDALAALGDREAAIAAYRDAVRHDPNDRAARQRLAALVTGSPD